MHFFPAGIIVSIFVFFTLFICILISMENRDPQKTLSWILVITLLPGVGFVLYLMFGKNVRKRRWEKVKKKIGHYLSNEEIKKVINASSLEELKNSLNFEKENFDPADYRIMKLVLNSGIAPVTFDNEVMIFTEGESKFAQMLKDLENAKHYIHLEYFIIRQSEIADKMRDVLIKKAQAGVKVRILYDDLGSWKLYLNPKYLEEMRQAGCEVVSFVQEKFPAIFFSLNYRDHRKICVIDGEIGYVGGINIGDEYVHKSRKFGFWRDTHLRIRGSAVYMLQVIFALGWYLRTEEMLIESKYFPPLEHKGSGIMQIAASGADTPAATIYQAYFYAIAQARESIYIETPYFIPDEAILTALKSAAMAGVDVRIIFPEKSDHYFVHIASLSYLEELLKFGAKVHFYEKGFIHSKMVLVDKEIVSVGTANMDIRSFMLNSEINAFIYDAETVDQLYQTFYEDIQECRPVRIEDIARKTFIGRLWQSICRLFSPVM